MTLTADMFWIVCPLAALAGFIDSIAGGGGIISLPAYYLAGLPPALAAGTNKLSAMMGAATATFNYMKAGKIVWRVGVPAVVGALICSTLGALTLTALPQDAARILVLCCIPVAAVFTLRRPKLREHRMLSETAKLWIAFGIGCVIGFYDGLIGPGAGAFYMIGFVTLAGYGVLRATAHTKLLNFASNLGGLIAFAAIGAPWWKLGLAMGLAQVAGARIGSKLAMRVGAKVIKPLLVTTSTLLALRLIWQML